MQILNCRCSVCGAVYSREIETNIGDYSDKSFVADPKDSKFFICLECKEWHEELMADYETDPWGWELGLDALKLEEETTEPVNDNVKE